MPMFLALILGAVGAAVASFACQYLLVPLVVRAIGEDKFAEMGGIDAISHALVAGLIGFIAYPLLGERFGYLSAAIIFPALGMLSAAYDVFLINLIGQFERRTEFILENDAIIRKKDGINLEPTYLRQETAYTQTDAFLGYSFYGLGLYDNSGELARNVYLSEAAMETALNTILNRNTKVLCHYLDLRLVYRESEFIWWMHTFGQGHAEILCGPLAGVSDECRDWWRQWLRPNFHENGLQLVSADEMKTYYHQLKAGYAELFPIENETVNTLSQLTHWPLPEYDEVDLSEAKRTKRHNDRVRCHWTILEAILQNSNGPFELMTLSRYNQEILKIVPGGGIIMQGNAEQRFFEVTLRPEK